MAPSRLLRSSLKILVLAAATLTLYHFRSSLQNAWVIARMPFVWTDQSSEFLISKEKDDFDLSFLNYSQTLDTSLPNYPDLVPPVLHHIAIGKRRVKTKWLEARESCLQYHPSWETHLWTDENAPQFVEEHFPNFKQTWDNYRYPIQRIDALRYMVLYEYGGVVLDMDLKCIRSLGPLRRFPFVAPGAHPTGFSIGMMMATAKHPFVGELVRNLPIFDQSWFGLPYPTVMFSTGCHYASAIHTLLKNRTELKVLAGPPEAPNLHSLNGEVITPLFHHLGTSSWHSYDGSFIVSLGKRKTHVRILFIGMCLGIIIAALVGSRLQRRRFAGVSLWQRAFRYSRTKREVQADMLLSRIA